MDHLKWGWPCISHQEYVVRLRKKDGRKGWQGGRDLADSAIWPARFCQALLKAWEESRAEVGLTNKPAMEIIQVEVD